MANQFHRLQTQAELHRPERTGRGNPNNITIFESEANFTIPEESGLTASDFIFSPEDGQYYQDLNTGDVYRFVKFETLGQEQSSLDVVGTTSNNKREAGTIHTSLRVNNDDVSAENTLTLDDGELLLMELENGESQVLTVDGQQTFDTSDMRLTLQEFTHAFNVGEFYEVTATVSRLKKGGIWKRLLEYDRDSETLTNVAGAGVKAQAIGEITVGFGGEEIEVETSGGGVFFRYDGENYPTRKDAREAAITDGLTEDEAEDSIKRFEVPPVTETRQVPRDVTQLTVNLFAELTEGEEITVVDLESKNAVKLTVNNDGNGELSAFGPGEDIVLDVQDDKIKPFFPIGSLIFGEEGYRESSIKVDPSRIQLNVLGVRGGDGIGTLVNAVGVGTTTQLSLKNIDEAVTLTDNQSLILMNKFGDTKRFTVNGGQTLTTGTDTLNVDSIVIASGEPTFEANTGIVKEPSYASSSRITVLEDEIVLKVDSDGNIAFIKLSGDPDDGTDITIKADQITVAGQTTFLSSLEGELDIPEDAVVIVSATEPTQRDNDDPLQAGDVWKNTSDNDLLYTYDGTDWIRSFTQINGGDIVTGTVTANKINVSDLFSENITVNSGGLIQSEGYNGSNGFQILSSGNARFQDIQITGNNSSVGDGAVLNNLTVLGQLTMGSGGNITNTSGDFSVTSSGIDVEAQGGNISGGARAINFKSGSSTVALMGGVVAGTPGAPNELQLSSDLIVASGDSKTTGDHTVNGSSSLIGTVEIGDPAAPNIILNANGNAGFNGTISGDGSGLSNVVKSVTAGTGISVSGSTGDVTISATGTGGVDMSNGANNRIVTAVDSDSLNGEANLTYDGSVLKNENGHLEIARSTTNFSVVEGLDSNNDGIAMGIDGNGWFYLAPYQSGSKNFNRELRWHGTNDRWEVDDDFFVGGVFTNPSDQRYKENIEPLQNSLDNLSQLQTIKYDMKDFLPEDERRMIGVFAQEVEQFYPEAVTDGTITDDDGNEHELKSVSYTQLVPVLIDAIKELKQQNEELKTRIEGLEQQS